MATKRSTKCARRPLPARRRRPRIAERERRWAAEMADLIADRLGRDAGLERLNTGAAIALKEQGLRIDARN